jgi:Ala-tRNA(Pro) deacylase
MAFIAGSIVAFCYISAGRWNRPEWPMACSFPVYGYILACALLYSYYRRGKKMDASSTYQDSLPISSDRLLEKLDSQNLGYKRIDHIPLRTVADSKQVRDGFLASEEGGGHIKNLYMRDKKKQNYLVVLQEDAELDLKYVAEKIGASRLSFGSADRLLENLGVRPGAVTPLSMITGVQNQVQLYIDASLKSKKLLYMHPLVNDRTIGMSPSDLEVFLTSLNADYHWIDFTK